MESKLREKKLKLILFGGKGGVGKTTCALSTALYLAEEAKTLIISTDPAHSLSDSLDYRIGDEIKKIQGIKNLSALEINSEKALSKFKIEYGDEIRKILDTSTYLDQDDINSVFGLSIPGIDEVMGFKTIVDLMELSEFDKYIVDTAPTGHALRLITLPVILDDWIKVMAKIRWKYRYMVKSFSGTYTPDVGDDFLLIMKKTVKKIETLLKDSKRCEFIVVTIPEAMAILETERLIKTLANYGIKVRHLLINNVLPECDCDFCTEKKEEQQKYINQIIAKFYNLKISIIPLQSREIKGMDRLKLFKGLLFQDKACPDGKLS